MSRNTISESRDSRIWQIGLGIVSFLILVVGWELLAHRLNSLLFPTFTETITAAAGLVVTPDFWQAMAVSHQALVVGFAFSVVVGTTVGLLIGRVRAAEKVLDPYINILLAMPMSALIPVIILAVGLGLPARALVVFLFSVIVIVVNTRTGLRTLDPSWAEMARSFGAKEWQLWRTIFLPGALPAMMSGFLLGLGRAMTGMITVELLLIAVGIGRLILDFQGTFEAGSVYATIMVVVAEAVILINVLKWTERRLSPWAGHVAVK
jgi:NitT/TauT family transport system permease protein